MSINKQCVRNVLKCKCFLPHDCLLIKCVSTLKNQLYTAAIVHNQFWHLSTSNAHNCGLIYAAQAP